ncbi:HEAT repeat domain-containing protein [Pseudomonas anguilliseptica]|uniref:HEAT repeat n=1 Tax=Pseudomonas anguilliseptica TaxID=53406 RepID=A0A1H4PGE1_PSEAG|nr:PBS lyase [Pseudomonas anguilliseptica]SEC06476.1 hypothetical protein SAMN05421553_0261 [Pseudomonas anguilliseptica]
MKHLKEWLARLKSRTVSGDYWENRRHHEALEVLAAGEAHGDWLTLSTHSNGFVREVAVRELSEQPSPDALAALLERVNDWVPQIRQLALDGVQHYLVPEHAPALLHALQPLMALAERQRADHSQTLAATREALQAPEVRNEVETAFTALHGKAARFLFALLLEASDEPAALLSKALGHREMTVRQLAVSACQTLPAELARPLLMQTLKTPGASVRVNALRCLLPLLDEPRALLREALMDPSPAVRSLARWAAPRWQVDAREVLDARLHQSAPCSKRDWLGLLGLACELAVELEEHWKDAAQQAPASSVRLAAVENLTQADLARQLMALDDSADKVFAKAVERLRTQDWNRVAREFDIRLDDGWYDLPSNRRTALLRLRPRWQQLAYLLRRLDNAPEEQAYWLEQVNIWCSGQYLMVDPVTAKPERELLTQRVERLEFDGLLLKGSANRLR